MTAGVQQTSVASAPILDQVVGEVVQLFRTSWQLGWTWRRYGSSSGMSGLGMAMRL